MEAKLLVAGIIDVKSALIMISLLGFTLYVLLFDIMRLSRDITLAESLLFCISGMWIYLYPRIKMPDIALLIDSVLISLQYTIFELFDIF